MYLLKANHKPVENLQSHTLPHLPTNKQAIVIQRNNHSHHSLAQLLQYSSHKQQQLPGN